MAFVQEIIDDAAGDVAKIIPTLFKGLDYIPVNMGIYIGITIVSTVATILSGGLSGIAGMCDYNPDFLSMEAVNVWRTIFAYSAPTCATGFFICYLLDRIEKKLDPKYDRVDIPPTQLSKMVRRIKEYNDRIV